MMSPFFRFLTPATKPLKPGRLVTVHGCDLDVGRGKRLPLTQQRGNPLAAMMPNGNALGHLEEAVGQAVRELGVPLAISLAGLKP